MAKPLVPQGMKPYHSKEVYGVMIRKLLPMGVLGVLAAALMAALMGNLSSASNSIATMVSYDIVKRFRPDTCDKKLVFIGRIATLDRHLLRHRAGPPARPLREHLQWRE